MPERSERLIRIGDGDAASSAAVEASLFRPSVYWYLSFRCNLACKHCWVNSSPWVDTSQDLDAEGAMRVVDQLAEFQVRRVNLTGGEVLLRADALDILRALAQRNIRIAVETNAMRVTESTAQLFRELQSRQLLDLSISLDGGTAEAHEALRGPRTFDTTVRKLDLLREHEVRFSVQAVLNRINYPTIPQLYGLAKRWLPCIRTLAFAFLNPVGRGSDLVREIGLRYRDYHLIFELIKAGLNDYDGRILVKSPPATVPPRYLSLVYRHPKVVTQVSCDFPLLGILPNGDVTICALSRENKDLYFGNIGERSLRQIWQEAHMGALRSRYIAAAHLTGICGECVFRHRCKGGCRAWAYEMEASFDAPLPLCAAIAEAGEFPAIYRRAQAGPSFADFVPAGCAGCP